MKWNATTDLEEMSLLVLVLWPIIMRYEEHYEYGEM